MHPRRAGVAGDRFVFGIHVEIGRALDLTVLIPIDRDVVVRVHLRFGGRIAERVDGVVERHNLGVGHAHIDDIVLISRRGRIVAGTAQNSERRFSQWRVVGVAPGLGLIPLSDDGILFDPRQQRDHPTMAGRTEDLVRGRNARVGTVRQDLAILSVPWHVIATGVSVRRRGDGPLADVVLALRLPTRFAGRLHGGQQEGNEHANDGNDD